MLEEMEQTGSRTEQMWNGFWIVGLTPLLLRNIRNNGGGCRCFLGWNGSISVTRADGSDRVRTGADVEQDLDCRVNPSSPQEYQE